MRVCVSLLLAQRPQSFSSPCRYISLLSSISGGILLLPQTATLSVGPHRVGVPVRGLSIFADAGPEEDAKVERSDRTPVLHAETLPHKVPSTVARRRSSSPQPYFDSCAWTGFGPRWATARHYVCCLVSCTASPYYFEAKFASLASFGTWGPWVWTCSSWLLLGNGCRKSLLGFSSSGVFCAACLGLQSVALSKRVNGAGFTLGLCRGRPLVQLL